MSLTGWFWVQKWTKTSRRNVSWCNFGITATCHVKLLGEKKTTQISLFFYWIFRMLRWKIFILLLHVFYTMFDQKGSDHFAFLIPFMCVKQKPTPKHLLWLHKCFCSGAKYTSAAKSRVLHLKTTRRTIRWIVTIQHIQTTGNDHLSSFTFDSFQSDPEAQQEHR